MTPAELIQWRISITQIWGLGFLAFAVIGYLADKCIEAFKRRK